MQLTITIHDSWSTAVPVALSRFLLAAAALERPRPPAADASDLTELLDGLLDDAPELAPSPAPPAAAKAPRPAPSPATPPAARDWDGVPRTGKGLYKWACNRKALPAVNRVGTSFGYPKRVSDWSDDQVAAAYRILTEPAANGAASR